MDLTKKSADELKEIITQKTSTEVEVNAALEALNKEIAPQKFCLLCKEETDSPCFPNKKAKATNETLSGCLFYAQKFFFGA